MSEILKKLDFIRLRTRAATSGPWRSCAWDIMEKPHVHKDFEGESVCRVTHDLPITKEDAVFIAYARTDMDRFERALRTAVEHLHACCECPIEGLDPPGPVCIHCREEQVLTAIMEGEND